MARIFRDDVAADQDHELGWGTFGVMPNEPSSSASRTVWMVDRALLHRALGRDVVGIALLGQPISLASQLLG